MQKRIQAGEWALGDRIPDEIDLSAEYGCARTTVNRALRALAEDGLVIRKRKGGTRVNPFPVRQAKLEIPVLREQIEATGASYRHQIIAQKQKCPPAAVRTRLRLNPGDKALYLETLHLADDRPFAFEVRWVNTGAVPEILEAPLNKISANEWLVKTAPFSSGDVLFTAANANRQISSALEASEGAAVFVIDRTTWLGDEFITTMKLYYREGYQLYSKL
ncbi:MAG: UTRA domain-containing protein [Pseudomonadota bacterium]